MSRGDTDNNLVVCALKIATKCSLNELASTAGHKEDLGVTIRSHRPILRSELYKVDQSCIVSEEKKQERVVDDEHICETNSWNGCEVDRDGHSVLNKMSSRSERPRK